ncbi:copper transporter [Nocardia puris]|uniref:Copper transport outer membrane protein MctB n=1 Tax=Nocardia puris TaxID=208602 RepID=A0A366D0D6_9NOCA|nr:copper transporter [Nocardia puris]MBF6215242.1 copper transporter [Nocardia puris]MBF6369708.1 copper transporter [Nocardia puris]MBF6463412.1 copper transporter [Nocardia puris]RBO82924.1 copper transport outer membrane protein MctB [Nocardia puris]
MISLRQHAISIVAIFLALAIGVVLGSQTLAADLLSGLRADKTDLRQQVDTLGDQNRRLTDELNAADRFIEGAGGRILGGALAQRSVVVFTTPDADPADVEAVSQGLATSGATVTGRIALTDAFTDATEGDRLRTAITNVIPAGAQLRTGGVDQGSIAGDLLGMVLLLDPANAQPRGTDQERALVLETLRGGGFLAYGDTPVQPAQLGVIVTGNGAKAAEDGQGANLAHFAGALRGRGAGIVLAGRTGASEGSGPIAELRSDAQLATTVTTVDNLDRAIGRVTAVLGLTEQLNGGAGRYGTGDKATSLTLAALPS